jgi:hypothetical protein
MWARRLEVVLGAWGRIRSLMTVISVALECASPDLSTGAVTEAIGQVCRCVTAHAMCLRGTWRHVWLSAVEDLL